MHIISNPTYIYFYTYNCYIYIIRMVCVCHLLNIDIQYTIYLWYITSIYKTIIEKI